MKTTIKILALLLTASLPGTFAAEFAGVSLPAAIDPLHVFGAWVITLMLLTLLSEYTRRATVLRVIPLAAATRAAGSPTLAVNPLAA